MDDATEPIPSAAPLADRIRGQLTPSRMIAGISTTVAIVAVAALVFVVTGEEPAGNAADKRSTPAVAASAPEPAQPLAAPPAPAPAPAAQPDPAPSLVAEPAASSPGSAAGSARNPLFTGVSPSSPPAPAAADDRRPYQVAPARPETSWAPTQWAIPGADPQRTADTVVGAVTGTAGWVGTGVFDLLGAAIVANGTGNWAGGSPSPEASLAALLMPASAGGPGLPAAVDVSRIPPPNLDFMQGVPPPNLDFMRGVPPPNLDFMRGVPPPNLDFLRSIPPPQPLAPPNLGFLQSIPPPRF